MIIRKNCTYYQIFFQRFTFETYFPYWSADNTDHRGNKNKEDIFLTASIETNNSSTDV